MELELRYIKGATETMTDQLIKTLCLQAGLAEVRDVEGLCICTSIVPGPFLFGTYVFPSRIPKRALFLCK